MTGICSRQLYAPFWLDCCSRLWSEQLDHHIPCCSAGGCWPLDPCPDFSLYFRSEYRNNSHSLSCCVGDGESFSDYCGICSFVVQYFRDDRMVAVQICADKTRAKIFSNCDAKKDNSDSVYIDCVFPYSDFIDFSFPLGGMTDV